MDDKKQQLRLALSKVRLSNPTHFLALGFGSGLISPAPGTWGTLAGWLIGVVTLQWLSPLWLLVPAAIGFAIGSYVCGKTAEDMGVHDHGAIVWDEIVAIWLVLAFVPAPTGFWFVAAFVLFRLFDILKPYPIKYFDHTVENGFGIMLDDLLAAIYTLIVMFLIFFVQAYF